MAFGAQETRLNVVPGGIIPVAHCKQYDVGRILTFEIYDGNSPAVLPGTATVTVDGKKPSGHGFSYPCTISGNSVTVSTSQQMTIESGTVECNLTFTDGSSNVVGTALFILDVEAAAVNETTDLSGSDLPIILALATEQEQNAEAWAVGTKNGVAVASTEPQYHNNSKYFVQFSEAWARGTREGNPVASTEPQYENNSKYYAETSEAWAVGRKNGEPVASTDPQYQNYSAYHAGLAASNAMTAHSYSVQAQSYATNSATAASQAETAYQNCLETLSSMNAYVALIRLIMGAVNIATESGDAILAENGDSIIIDF